MADSVDAEMNHEKVVEDFFAELDAPEAPETLETPEVDESPVEEPEVAPEASEDPEDEDSESEEEPDPTEDPQDEALVDWEKRYKDQQSYHDQKIAAVEQQLAQMNEWAQNVYQQQLLQAQQAQAAAQQAAQQAPQTQHVTDQQLLNAVDQDVQRTFQWVALNRPDLVPKVVSMTRKNEKYGHDVADEMLLEFTTYQAQQQQARFEAAEQARAQQEAAARAPQQIQETMSSMISGIEQQYGESYKAVELDFIARATETAPQFREYMEAQGLALTPDAIHYFLTKTFNDIREENLSKQASKPRKARKVAPGEHAETSTQGQGPDDELTADQLAINEILSGAKELAIDTNVPTR